MNEKYWILYKDTRASLIKGWFNTLDKAVEYYNTCKLPVKNKTAIFKDSVQVYPKE
jgi:hypothetical protein